MNTKTISYIVAVIGVIALIAGAYIKFATTHHHGVEAMAAGAVLVIAGLVGSFVLKPKVA